MTTATVRWAGWILANGMVFGVLAVAGSVLPASAGTDRSTDTPATTLLCNFKAVQLGQFQRLGFISSPADGTISMTLVASSDDRKAGRAVVIDDGRAAVVALIVQSRQTLYIDGGTPDDAALISVFTNAQSGSALPASYSRHMVLGTIPVVSQYAGSCMPQS